MNFLTMIESDIKTSTAVLALAVDKPRASSRRNHFGSTSASAVSSNSKRLMEAQMRLDLGGSLIVFVWSENRYRTEAVRLLQGINRRLVRLVRARKLLSLRLILVRRVSADGPG